MIPSQAARLTSILRRAIVFVVVVLPMMHAHAQPAASSHSYFIDCSAAGSGDGSMAHPWNTLAAAQAQVFQPGDRIALKRGTTCQGAFAPRGSGTEGGVIHLTAYGHGPRPRIVAPADARAILQLHNQEYWQIDSLDLSGASAYGIFVNGDGGPLRHIYLKNLYVHDVRGGPLKNKDNGLVVVGRGSETAVFDDVLVDGVDAAHTNQWAGIFVGAGNFGNGTNPALNRHIMIRNSTVHDIYGDGIILFRGQDGSIRASAAWQTGMQPTETTGTPNAIWTWTCIDCTVEDNEAWLTDSPGVDGGAYDIDWHNTRNSVARNFAHDTQGYCVAVFAAGFTTSESTVRDNLCVDNGLSPRLSVLQGAVYLHTWNNGPIRGLQFTNNTIEWDPPVADAAAIVNDALLKDAAVFAHNRVVSTTRRIYSSNTQLSFADNRYSTAGQALFDVGDRHNVSLEALQKLGSEKGSVVSQMPARLPQATSLGMEAGVDLAIDADGLIGTDARAQLVVLRSLAGQYGLQRLHVTVHLSNQNAGSSEANALRDLEDVYPGALHFDHDVAHVPAGTVRLLSATGESLDEWHGFQNAATLGGAVRARLGRPQYAHMQSLETPEEK